MLTQINEISKVFLHGETLESSELNAIISQINSTIRKLNSVETSLDNHEYDVSIPITNIYCRTKKGISANGFFPEADAKRDELLLLVSNCSITQGIKYNTTFSVVTLSANVDAMNGVWTAYPQGVNKSLPHEWEVSYKKLSDNSIMYMYGPVLRSNYGFNGSDGDSVQYIYKIFDHQLTDEERTNNTPTRPENPNSNGEFIPSGWFDDPQNTTSEYPFLYVSALKKINGIWSSFEKISLWSTYSEDGTNGDFLARVFCRFVPTPNKSAPNTPIGGIYENPQPGSNDNILWSLTVPEGQEPLWTSTRIFKGNDLVTTWSTPVIEVDTNELDIEYSSSAERPANNTLRNVPGEPHPSTGIWHDPSENNLDLSTMIWRAERKIKNGQYNGEWVITKIVGLKGSFKSIVFRRFKPSVLQRIPATPTGGTYNNPIPEGNLWYDGIPAGDSKVEGPVWASTRTFYDDGTVTTWSEPKLQADSEDLDIEFSPSATQPSNPTGEPFSNREASGWYDPSSNNFNSVGPMIWRAERKVKNGQYEGLWTVTRILGEKGEEGKRGGFKSCVFKRSNSALSDFNVTINGTGDGATYDSPIPNGSGVFAGWNDGIPAGKETLWMAVSYFTGEEDTHSNWTVTQQTDSVDLDIEFSPGEGSAHTCPTMSNSVFDTPIANYEINGNPPAITNERDLRNRLGWWDASLIDSQSPTMIWRAERKVHNLLYEGNWVITRILGEKGDSATLSTTQVEDLELAGLQIVVTPLTIILEQSDVLDATHLDRIENVTSNIAVYNNRTGNSLTNDKYWIKKENENPKVELYATDAVVNDVLLPLTPLGDYVSVTGADTINAKSITINNLPYINNNGDYSYLYDKGFVRVYLEISVGTSRNTRTIKIDIPWYLNKLGERITKLKGDISETYLSRDVFTNNPLNLTIKLEFDTYINLSAKGTLELYSLVTTDALTGNIISNVPTKTEFATYLRNVSENISKLNKSVTGTNLIADNGWCKSFTTISSKKRTACSPFVYLKPGKYIFSTYINSNTSIDDTIKLGVKLSNTKLNPSTLLTDFANEGWTTVSYNGVLTANVNTRYEGDYYPSANVSPNYVRMYFVFTVNESSSNETYKEGYYTFHVSLNNTNFTTCIRPQLELCLDTNTDLMPTAWTPGPQDFSSEIKLTADSISLNVTSALNTADNINSNLIETGINITGSNRGIEMTADNFTLKDTNNNLVFGKDPNTNNMTFTGEVRASSLVAGDSNNLTIETSGNTIKFNNGGVTKAYFIAEGDGLQLYIKSSGTGADSVWKKIDFSTWASGVEGDTTDRDITFYTLKSSSSSTSNGGEVSTTLEVPYNTNLNKYYEDRSGITLKTLGSSPLYYKKEKVLNVVISENSNYYIYRGNTEDNTVYKYTPITITDGVLTASGTPYFAVNGKYLSRSSLLTVSTSNIYYKGESVSIKDTGGSMNHTESSLTIDILTKVSDITTLSAYSTITSQNYGAGTSAGFQYVASSVNVSS